MRKLVWDTRTVFLRELMPTLRRPSALIYTMGQPLLFLVLFGSLLAGSQGGASPWQWFVPGILIMMCLSGPMMSGYTLLTELLSGSFERILVSPVDRSALLFGRTLKEFLLLLVQALLIIAVATPLGFELFPLGVLAGLALLVVFGSGLIALSYLLAIASRPSGELFYGVTQMVMFPVLLLSGVLLPVQSGPEWLRVIAALNPVSYLVDAERALFAGRFAEPAVLYGAVTAFGFAAVGLFFGTRAMRKGI
ncbi:ABC transporter permease [Allokutzneria albata]|uniref:Transport permease protein n=1 Tax=Allokutzneria albata TaxID=211114 RepID=A0A1G9TJS1_ALLAB|nr:ABC transporter permease [Allokutzneria albata]SDM48006.1 ABC-2 type transport system permease protein [Allokutzneria albata]